MHNFSKKFLDMDIEDMFTEIFSPATITTSKVNLKVRHISIDGKESIQIVVETDNTPDQLYTLSIETAKQFKKQFDLALARSHSKEETK